MPRLSDLPKVAACPAAQADMEVGMGPSRHRIYWSAAIAVGALVLAGCGSSGSSSGSGTGIKSGGSITYALDEDVAGFNINQADDSEFVLAEILDQVWPSVFITQPNATVKLNTDLVSSAKLTST